MMTLSTMVSQPVWILVTLIGVADILILAWCIALIRRNRNQRHRDGTRERDTFVPFPEHPLPVGQFQQDLTFLQIDAVFDGLAAIIETERVKLKSMIHPAAAPVRAAAPSPQEAPEDTRATAADDAPQAPMSELPVSEPPLDQQITRIADSGMKPAAIANRLGISLAEVNLALRMRNGAKSASGYKLEAVA